jgi:hypothetical protein
MISTLCQVLSRFGKRLRKFSSFCTLLRLSLPPRVSNDSAYVRDIQVHPSVIQMRLLHRKISRRGFVNAFLFDFSYEVPTRPSCFRYLQLDLRSPKEQKKSKIYSSYSTTAITVCLGLDKRAMVQTCGSKDGLSLSCRIPLTLQKWLKIEADPATVMLSILMLT